MICALIALAPVAIVAVSLIWLALGWAARLDAALSAIDLTDEETGCADAMRGGEK